ncbi:MAG: (4Fe-4S)-binding protein [Terrimonas ferruginea]|jgi:uncharacterized Fe-S cluster protein YjdI|uniref:(4Fe-4S)-binding protein n=1 Tax=Terrimonas ferruginea TaxID=249 RepID=UPI0009261567|nr:(4Fe-4S)-binding protein [Terrimonas ferruginea]MBN8783467.1 (4Fe-4S)-binding protein [Terrimonas ferruginea]OJW40228.1 MAG: hypothetical protein BGO56_09210 [Sphingobacteriales bacterium 48-107]
MDKEITRKYTNGEVTVVWKPAACIHSKVCWQAATGLPEVFDPRRKPWIIMDNAGTARIVDQVKKCPSGALSFYYNNETDASAEVTTETRVEVVADGPLMVYGNLTVKDKTGQEEKKFRVTAFCRCGYSQNKPYCDGSHITEKFSG